jgi:hypothetical protein
VAHGMHLDVVLWDTPLVTWCPCPSKRIFRVLIIEETLIACIRSAGFSGVVHESGVELRPVIRGHIIILDVCAFWGVGGDGLAIVDWEAGEGEGSSGMQISGDGVVEGRPDILVLYGCSSWWDEASEAGENEQARKKKHFRDSWWHTVCVGGVIIYNKVRPAIPSLYGR